MIYLKNFLLMIFKVNYKYIFILKIKYNYFKLKILLYL